MFNCTIYQPKSGSLALCVDGSVTTLTVEQIYDLQIDVNKISNFSLDAFREFYRLEYENAQIDNR